MRQGVMALITELAQTSKNWGDGITPWDEEGIRT